MPPAGGAIGSRCATHGTIHRARRAIRWCAAVPPAWPAAASATAARIRHRSTGRRTRHPRPDVAFLVSRPSHAPNMLMLGGIDSHSTCTFKHTFKTASKGLPVELAAIFERVAMLSNQQKEHALCLMDRHAWLLPVEV